MVAVKNTITIVGCLQWDMMIDISSLDPKGLGELFALQIEVGIKLAISKKNAK